MHLLSNQPSTNVFLNSILDSEQNDQNLEPQFIRIRSNNTSYCYLDITDGTYIGSAKYNIGGTSNDIFTSGIHRLAMQSCSFNINSPNINIYNNTFVFTTNGVNKYTVTIPEGFYSATNGLAALVAALNGSGSGLTFSTTLIVDSNLYRLTSVGGNFSFLSTPESTGINRGRFCFGIRPNTPLSNFLVIGSVLMYYTRYIDVNSSALTQFAKLLPGGKDVSRTNLCRLFFPYNTTNNNGVFAIQAPLQWYNFNPGYAIQSVDISLTDEFGLPLYLPSYNYNFALQFILIIEK